MRLHTAGDVSPSARHQSNFLSSLSRSGRIAIVTFGLSAVGAIVGAAAGALALSLDLVLGGEHLAFLDLVILLFPAGLGAFLGAILTPIAAWMLLRRVPLGRAFLGLAAGTITGGVLGWFFTGGWDRFEAAIAAAIAGFVIAAVTLRYVGNTRANPQPNETWTSTSTYD